MEIWYEVFSGIKVPLNHNGVVASQQLKLSVIPFSLHVGVKPWYVKSHQERMNTNGTSER